MSGVGQDGALLHILKVLFSDHFDLAGTCYKYVTAFNNVKQSLNSKPVHTRFQRPYMIDFCNCNYGTHSACSGSNTFPYPPISANDNLFSGHKNSCCSHKSIDGTLACSITI